MDGGCVLTFAGIMSSIFGYFLEGTMLILNKRPGPTGLDQNIPNICGINICFQENRARSKQRLANNISLYAWRMKKKKKKKKKKEKIAL